MFFGDAMQQVSNYIYCDDFIASLKLESRLMPNPYYDYPILLIENFLPIELCMAICHDAMADNDAQQAMLKSMVQGVVDADVDEQIRKTVIHKLPDPFLEEYMAAFAAHQKQIEDFFALALTTATTVQVLEYTPGAFYIKHADDSSELVNTEGETVGFVQVAPQRKISSVLFASSHKSRECIGECFEGGELVFNYLYDKQGQPFTLHPKAGDMVIFPSNPIYSHEVLPVKEGYRLTLVQWHNAIVD